MMQQGCSLAWTDWNYHLPLTSERGGYERLLCTGRRTILRRASRDHFHLETVDDDPLRAYNIVEAHHAAKGYPMRMSARQILDTTGVDGPVDAHFFVLTDGSRDAAAAIVYDTTPDIAQVIYWADNPSAGAFAPMNLLCARLHDHYAARGLQNTRHRSIIERRSCRHRSMRLQGESRVCSDGQAYHYTLKSPAADSAPKKMLFIFHT